MANIERSCTDVRKLQTLPASHFYDNVLWPIIHPLFSGKTDDKLSYWWHWVDEVIPVGSKRLILPGDSSSLKIRNFLDAIKMSLGAWQNAYLIQPDLEAINNSPRIRDGWRYGFILNSVEPNRAQMCTIVLPSRLPVAVLQGSDDVEGVGLDLYGRRIPLELVGHIDRRSERPEGCLLI